ncbi:hypothetical protein MATL_G00033530 [Megalops atlanticus]|uniref:Agouti domain-containing protein n=1 Tax=Megalops atlanticus TaxID=7932 RepID=A0A9D3QIR9_MEGAT|nr:hypothetical protein MATL_G00033530 [Megalops atlanticus]
MPSRTLCLDLPIGTRELLGGGNELGSYICRDTMLADVSHPKGESETLRICHQPRKPSMMDPRDMQKNTDADESLKDPPSVETGVWIQGKTKTLFARRGVQEQQRLRAAKTKPELVAPVKRCSRVMESCVPNTPCCDPCASCHCRFFNAICYCWRLGRHCQKKT